MFSAGHHHNGSREVMVDGACAQDTPAGGRGHDLEIEMRKVIF